MSDGLDVSRIIKIFSLIFVLVLSGLAIYSYTFKSAQEENVTIIEAPSDVTRTQPTTPNPSPTLIRDVTQTEAPEEHGSPQPSPVVTNPQPTPAPTPTPSTTPNPTPPGSASIIVDANTTFQTMEGFGSSQRIFDDPHVTETFDPATQRASVLLTAAQQDAILDRLYIDLGLTRVRPATENGVQLTRAGPFNFAWKRNDDHVDYVKRAKARGLTTYFLSPIVPESWMGNTTAQDAMDRANYALAIIRRWRALGLELPYYSVANEPGFKGNPMSGAFIRDIIKIMGPQLRAEGFATKFVITDDIGPAEAASRSQTILADPVARSYVGALATHLYWGRDLSGLVSLSTQYNLPIWMTEYFRGSGALNGDAFDYAALMHDMISQWNVSALDYMWGFFGQWEKGTQLIILNYSTPTYQGYTLDKAYYTIGQFSKYVRPGAKRILVSSSDSTIKMTAYKDTQNLIIVGVNNTASDKNVQVKINGVPASSQVQVVRTSANENWAQLANMTLASSMFTTSLPQKSVTTFIISLP